MAGRAYLAILAVLLLAAGPCTALRTLHQADAGTAATPAGPPTAPSTRALALQQASDDTAAPAAAPTAVPTALSSQAETTQQRHAGAALQQDSDGSAAPAASPAVALAAPSRAEAGVSYIQVSLCLVSPSCFTILREDYHAWLEIQNNSHKLSLPLCLCIRPQSYCSSTALTNWAMCLCLMQVFAQPMF